MTDSTTTSTRPIVGFVGLGDQGLPMATAIAEAGFELHLWARRPADLEAMGDVGYRAHESAAQLAAVSDLVALCVSTDEGVFDLAAQMLPKLRPGSILVNHGTGTPSNAQRLTKLFCDRDIDVLDAPVSGGRPAAMQRRLTVLAGGPENALRRAEPVFRSFARHVVHLGEAGCGQLAKLFNNTLLMMNQASIADILDLAAQAEADPVRLVEALKLCSGSSAALTLLNTMVTPETVAHLSEIQALDMEIFDHAMREATLDASDVTERGLLGARRLASVIDRLNPADRVL